MMLTFYDSALTITCHNRFCFNYEHLYIGTQSENIKDSVLMRTQHFAAKDHCKYGHELRQGKRQRWCPKCAAIYYKSKTGKVA